MVPRSSASSAQIFSTRTPERFFLGVEEDCICVNLMHLVSNLIAKVKILLDSGLLALQPESYLSSKSYPEILKHAAFGKANAEAIVCCRGASELSNKRQRSFGRVDLKQRTSSFV